MDSAVFKQATDALTKTTEELISVRQDISRAELDLERLRDKEVTTAKQQKEFAAKVQAMVAEMAP